LTATAPVAARERILRATLDLIAAEGVAAVTNRRVAAAAEVSLGSLTYHFDSQSELLRESLLLYMQEETERREQAAHELERHGATLERVVEMVEQLAGDPTEAPRQIAELELHLQAARDPQLREASRGCFQAHDRIAVAALTALGIPDAQRHAGTVVALVTGLAVRRLAEGGADASGTAEALIALVRGLRPDGSSEARGLTASAR